jgi:hypothetical protein
MEESKMTALLERHIGPVVDTLSRAAPEVLWFSKTIIITNVKGTKINHPRMV